MSWRSPPPATRSPSNEARADEGSALADALVALAVIMITLTLTAEAVRSGIGRTHHEEEVRWAVLEARSRLAQVGADIPAREGHSSGRDGPLSWSIDVRPSSAAPGLVEAAVEVDDQQGRTVTSLRTLISAEP